MSDTPLVIVGPEGPLADELAAEIGVEPLRTHADELNGSLDRWRGEHLVWVHLVPCGADGSDRFSEARALLASAEAASLTADAAGAELVFVALVPSRGMFAGEAGLACDLARTSLLGLMEARIKEWSAAGRRIAGVVYAGIEGHLLEGQRSPEEVVERTPMKRAARVADLADAVRFLGSKRAAYVTGAFLHVDGGWNAYSWIYPARTI